jgi:hypothetical protein
LGGGERAWQSPIDPTPVYGFNLGLIDTPFMRRRANSDQHRTQDDTLVADMTADGLHRKRVHRNARIRTDSR